MCYTKGITTTLGLTTKTCTDCGVSKSYTKTYFPPCKKTKSGLGAKCRECKNEETKVWMRKTRFSRRLKKLGLYNGTLSRLDINNLSKEQLVDCCWELSRQLLYSGQSSRFCQECQEYHKKHKNVHKNKTQER